MDNPVDLKRFVLAFLADIDADVREQDGLYTVVFPPGRKRKFGRERVVTFDPEKRREHVELIEPGSPFLKMLLVEAKQTGGLAAYPSNRFPVGTRVYTFRFETYSSLKKRTHFAWAALEPGQNEPRVQDGLPPFLDDEPGPVPVTPGDVGALDDGLETVVPAVERNAQTFAKTAVEESREGFEKAMGRVQEYLQGMQHDTYLEEARIRRRLGEIQSKLYFTEDGLREIKLQREQEKLTRELHSLKKKNVEAQTAIQDERQKHQDQLRRRHEPKLRIVLAGATLIRPPGAATKTPRREPDTAAP